jgi:hypothetical protein
MGYYVADNMNTESSVKAQYGYKAKKEQWNTIDSSSDRGLQYCAMITKL